MITTKLKPWIMNKTLLISTSFDQSDLLENMIKKLVNRKPDYGITGLKMPDGLKAIDSSATEVYVSGTVDFNYLITENREDYIRMPFITSFLFTCIKTKKSKFQLAWSSSLS